MKRIDKYLQIKNENFDIIEKSDITNTPEERAINNVLKSLLEETQYKPDDTVKLIENEYIENSNGKFRIMYSVISANVLFGKYKIDALYSNVEELKAFVLDDKNGVKIDCKRIALKLYDHILLVLAQSDKFAEIYDDIVKIQKEFNKNLEESNNMLNKMLEIQERVVKVQEKIKEDVDFVKEDMERIKEETRGIQKEHISILGIFSGVVLTFVGGIVVSNSILQNADKIGIYRLILILDMLAIFLINVIYMMFKFVWKIQGRDKKDIFFGIGGINTILILIFLLCLYMINKYNIV